jgi:hypothetical protein
MVAFTARHNVYPEVNVKLWLKEVNLNYYHEQIQLYATTEITM